MLFTKYLQPDAPARVRLAWGGWTVLAVTGLGCCVGLLSLLLAAFSYSALDGRELFRSYFTAPLIPALNLLTPVLLIWLFFLLTRRAWAGFLGAFLPVMGITLVNYFKIRLRSDPFLAVDLRLAAEAGNIVGGYTLDLTTPVWLTLGCFLAGLLFALLAVPRLPLKWPERGLGLGACLALTAVSFSALFTSPQVYQAAVNDSLINPWSDVEVFLSKGCVYPFLYSARELFPAPPEGYDAQEAAALLARYPDTDIPESKKVSVVAVMLEAFADFTDFPALAGEEGVAAAYAPWHALEEQSVSGDLLTNIFAGGTVDSEWGFLTGYTQHSDFRSPTDSYVWYLKGQGYQTFGSHPGHGWFYNRQNVNTYLGFDEYWFTENHYGTLVDPVTAVYHSDGILVRELLAQLEERSQAGPCFSFSVSYQNHGPYDTQAAQTSYVSDAVPLSPESRNILDHYLGGIAETAQAMSDLAAGLEELEEPVVLVLFGDHKPWGGNGNSVYTELGADFDLSTAEGFKEYYSTPYLIWANSAAKEVLGNSFTGDGGDFSPCFLMAELFDLCGWEGPGFLQLSRQVRSATPMVHTLGLYWRDGGPTSELPEADAAFLADFLRAQYYREHELK